MNFPQPDKFDWIYFRQLLSLALFKAETVRVKTGYFFQNNLEYQYLADDFFSLIKDLKLGEIKKEEDLIIYHPQQNISNFIVYQTENFSSIIEFFLFLLPILFLEDFRVILNWEGVTHSPLSYPTAFIKETFLPLLARWGLYASFRLEQFGFMGSALGKAEARVYPSEFTREEKNLDFTKGTISRVKIYFAKLNKEMAQKEKEIFKKGLELKDDQISIIEVANSSVFGNSIQVYIESDQIPLIFFREISFYNAAGDFIYDPGDHYDILQNLILEIKNFKDKKILPPYLLREYNFYKDLVFNNLTEKK